MLGEKVRFVTMTVGEKVYHNVLFFMNVDRDISMAIKTADQSFESQGPDFRESLTRLFEKLPEQSKITMVDEIAISSFRQTLNVQSTISLRYSEDAESDVLHYVLVTDYKGKEISVECEEDFSIPLQKIKNIINAEFHICAYCQLSDFKSDGGEELRHGWYCFRNVDEDLSIPWFERMEGFEKAIPNVDAFHWCPQFCQSTRRL